MNLTRADACTGPRRRYAVAVTHPDGSVTRYTAIGSTSTDQAIAATERAGLGCKVTVEAMPPALQELLDDFSERMGVQF